MTIKPNTDTTTISAHELKRLRGVERTWEAVWAALIAGNDRAFSLPLSGQDCAILEIQRLQGLAARIPAGFWLAPDEPSEAMLAASYFHARDHRNVYLAMRQAHNAATEALAKEKQA